MNLSRLKQLIISRSQAFRDATTIAILAIGVLGLTMNFDEFNKVIGWLYRHDTQRLDLFFSVIVFLLPAILIYAWRRHKEMEEQMRHRFLAEQEKERLVPQLENALSDLSVLRSLLPLCPSCKRVRDSKGNWYQVEVYIEARLDQKPALGLCPDCAKQSYRHQG